MEQEHQVTLKQKVQAFLDGQEAYSATEQVIELVHRRSLRMNRLQHVAEVRRQFFDHFSKRTPGDTRLGRLKCATAFVVAEKAQGGLGCLIQVVAAQSAAPAIDAGEK